MQKTTEEKRTKYRFIIDNFTWSWSKISCFNDCPYRFFLQYLTGESEIPMFYSSYGSYVHELIERYYKGEIDKNQLYVTFLLGYKSNVAGERPATSTVKSYINGALDYFKNFKPFPFDPISVEKKINFKIGEFPFTGILDYVGKGKDGIYIVDNKSRDLKPRSGKTPPLKRDEELNAMLRQLYVYSAAAKQEYGEYPKGLCFNCFRTGVFITEPFDKSTYEKTCCEAIDTIDAIRNTDTFEARPEYFKCRYICSVRNECCYAQ